MKNGIQILGDNLVSFQLLAQIPSQTMNEATRKTLQAASLWFFETKQGKTVDNVQVPSGPLTLDEERYVYTDFRALSQVFLQNRGLDFSRPGVLEEAAPLLKGKTIYANHDFRDIDNWRGVITASAWDAAGAGYQNVPGINVQTKVDAFLNYRTACGLTMTPPAINAVSVTVVSEVEFSHPELVKDGTFWNRFLEEVDGEIVRLIVTKITEFWEMSFVFLGEDRLATQPPVPEPDDEDDEALMGGKRKTKKSMSAALPQTATEKKKMKVTAEQTKLLGLTVEGEEVDEQLILNAALELARASALSPQQLTELSRNAKAGEMLLEEKRTEVTRLAKLAELGSEEGTLDAVVADPITQADAEKLIRLEAYYLGKVGNRFPTGGRRLT